MNLRQIQYFLEIYRTKSFSTAARNLNLTQPALSNQIILLEQELKGKLFNRNRREITPTSAGEAVYEKAQRLLEVFQELEQVVGNVQSPRQITFASGETLAAHVIPKLMIRLRSLFPQTRFRVVEGHLTEMAQALMKNTVDFALIPEGVADAHFANEYFISDTIIPVVARNFVARTDRKSGKSSMSWSDLRKREWVLFHQGSAIRKITDEIFRNCEEGFSPVVAMELRSLSGVVNCIEAGCGVGFISDLSVTPHLQKINLPELARERKFFVSFRHEYRNQLKPVIDAIMSFI